MAVIGSHVPEIVAYVAVACLVLAGPTLALILAALYAHRWRQRRQLARAIQDRRLDQMVRGGRVAVYSNGAVAVSLAAAAHDRIYRR